VEEVVVDEVLTCINERSFQINEEKLIETARNDLTSKFFFPNNASKF
jgi:hypothetical protein